MFSLFLRLEKASLPLGFSFISSPFLHANREVQKGLSSSELSSFGSTVSCPVGICCYSDVALFQDLGYKVSLTYAFVFCVVFCRVEPGLHLGEYLICHFADCMLWSSRIYYQLTILCWMFIFNRAQQWLLIFWMAPIPELNFQFIPSNVVLRKFSCIYSFKS